MLKRHPDWAVRVLVVWEAVQLPDRLGPPRGTEERIADGRARHFWDGGLILSKRIVHELGHDPTRLEGEKVTPDTIIWDVAAVYRPGARWNGGMPAPEYFGYPVVDVAGELERRLASILTP